MITSDGERRARRSRRSSDRASSPDMDYAFMEDRRKILLHTASFWSVSMHSTRTGMCDQL